MQRSWLTKKAKLVLTGTGAKIKVVLSDSALHMAETTIQPYFLYDFLVAYYASIPTEKLSEPERVRKMAMLAAQRSREEKSDDQG